MSRTVSIAIAAVSSIWLSQAALAADLPRKGPAPAVAPAAVPTWTGFYLGLHAGWGWTSSDDASAEHVVAVAPGIFGSPVPFSLDSNGPVVGGHIGYNWQFAPNWVLGIEGDWSGTFMKEAASGDVLLAAAPGVVLGNASLSRDINWL